MLALPCIFLYEHGAFGEFDYWAGTFSLVLFALAESILFSWVFGIDKGWEEINRGADIRIPNFFKFVIKYVTPLFLLAVFVGSMIKPAGGEWNSAATSLFSGGGWPLAPDSVIGTIFNVGVADTRWFVGGEPTTVFVIDATRILLCLVFIGIALLVKKAWNNKERIA